MVDDVAWVVERRVVQARQHDEFLTLIPAPVDQNAIDVVSMQDGNILRTECRLVAAQQNAVAPELEQPLAQIDIPAVAQKVLPIRQDETVVIDEVLLKTHFF